MNKTESSIDRLSVLEVTPSALIYDNSLVSVFTQLIGCATAGDHFTVTVRQLQRQHILGLAVGLRLGLQALDFCCAQARLIG